MSVCSDNGYTDGAIDPTNGVPYYCLDPVGNPVYLSGTSGGVNTVPVATPSPGATPVPLGAAAGAPSSVTGDISAIEADIIAGWRAITAPPAPPPGTGVLSLTGGAAGTQLTFSPILLVAAVVIAYLVLRK